MKKFHGAVFKCGFVVGRVVLYYPKALKNELLKVKRLQRKKI